jgi:hypothetical protein
LVLAELNFDALPPSAVATGALLVVVGSLHHLFTSIGPTGLGQFLVVQFAVAVGLGVIVFVNRDTLKERVSVNADVQ